MIIAIDEDPIKFKKFYQGLEDVIGETDIKLVSLKIIRGDETIETVVYLK